MHLSIHLTTVLEGYIRLLYSRTIALEVCMSGNVCVANLRCCGFRLCSCLIITDLLSILSDG